MGGREGWVSGAWKDGGKDEWVERGWMEEGTGRGWKEGRREDEGREHRQMDRLLICPCVSHSICPYYQSELESQVTRLSVLPKPEAFPTRISEAFLAILQSQ